MGETDHRCTINSPEERLFNGTATGTHILSGVKTGGASLQSSTTSEPVLSPILNADATGPTTVMSC